jgi:hypothetical protein
VSRRAVLFLYNETDWAIHNVGRDWASLMAASHDFTLTRFGTHESLDPDAFQSLVYGYSTLGYSGRLLLRTLLERPRGWLRWQGLASGRVSAVVQDPSEVFPEQEAWHTAPARLENLKRFGRLAVTSREMQAALAARGLDASLVPTRSLLPVRDAGGIGREPLRVFTRAREYPRKNLALFRAIRRAIAGEIEHFDAWLGGEVLAMPEYAARIDRYNCYVCTSWQEGGPLPLADALHRGCVVLTTRVGQTDDWVVHGENGWFCDRESDFVARLRELNADPERLRRMRCAAVERARVPDVARVRTGLEAFLS